MLIVYVASQSIVTFSSTAAGAGVADDGSPFVDDDFVDDDFVTPFAPMTLVAPVEDMVRERDHDRREADRALRSAVVDVAEEPPVSIPAPSIQTLPLPPAVTAPPPAVIATTPVATVREHREASRWSKFMARVKELWRRLTNWEASPTLKGLEWASAYALSLAAA